MNDENDKLAAAAKRVVEKIRDMDPRAHFEKMVERGIIDRQGRPTSLVPGAREYEKPRR